MESIRSTFKVVKNFSALGTPVLSVTLSGNNFRVTNQMTGEFKEFSYAGVFLDSEKIEYYKYSYEIKHFITTLFPGISTVEIDEKTAQKISDIIECNRLCS